jgi:hypothetical protein
MKTVRRKIANIRSPIGTVDAAVSTPGGPGCRGSALIASNLPANCSRTVIEKRSVMQALGKETALAGLAHRPWQN